MGSPKPSFSAIPISVMRRNDKRRMIIREVTANGITSVIHSILAKINKESAPLPSPARLKDSPGADTTGFNGNIYYN